MAIEALILPGGVATVLTVQLTFAAVTKATVVSTAAVQVTVEVATVLAAPFSAVVAVGSQRQLK